MEFSLIDDRVYSPVLGGCNIANVIDFPSMFDSVRVKVDKSSLPSYPSNFFIVKERGVYFYTCYLHWFDCLNAGRVAYKVLQCHACHLLPA